MEYERPEVEIIELEDADIMTNEGIYVDSNPHPGDLPGT